MSAPAWLRSVGAVVGGFATTVILSTAADAAMVAAGVFPPAGGKPMSEGMFLLAAAYRLAFTVVGGYVAARLAPDRPMRHAMVLAGIGVLAGLGGLVAFYRIGGPAMGPAWYAIQIPLTAIPGVWAGARLAIRGRPLGA